MKKQVYIDNYKAGFIRYKGKNLYIKTLDNGIKIVKSYDTIVGVLLDSKLVEYAYGEISSTTSRHLTEIARKYGVSRVHVPYSTFEKVLRKYGYEDTSL